MRVDVVGERVDGLLVGRVPLHRDLDVALLVLAFEVGDALVDRVLGGVDVRHEISDPTLVMELDGLTAGAFVSQDDVQTAGQKRRLAEPLLQGVRRELDLLEDLRVREERDRGARIALLGLADDLDVGVRHTAREFLTVDLPVTAHLGDQPLRERVHDRDADAVETARDLVRGVLASELSSGVQLREDHGQRGRALVLHHVDRDARAVVADGHRIVSMESHFDLVVAAG